MRVGPTSQRRDEVRGDERRDPCGTHEQRLEHPYELPRLRMSNPGDIRICGFMGQNATPARWGADVRSGPNTRADSRPARVERESTRTAEDICVSWWMYPALAVGVLVLIDVLIIVWIALMARPRDETDDERGHLNPR